jgi:ribosome-associated protein
VSSHEEETSSRDVLLAAVRGADAKLGDEIVALDVSELLSVVDFFLIVAGRNSRQVATLVDEIEAWTKREVGRGPLRVEGLRDATWVLMDYGDVVIHVFVDETRRYYDLEHLWSGAPRVDLSGVVGVGERQSSAVI